MVFVRSLMDTWSCSDLNTLHLVLKPVERNENCRVKKFNQAELKFVIINDN